MTSSTHYVTTRLPTNRIQLGRIINVTNSYDRAIGTTLTTEYHSSDTNLRRGATSATNAMTANGTSGSRLVRTGQHPVKGHEASQHDETSVEGRLGENRGGVERPMDPKSYRTSECIPCFPGR